MSRPTPPSPRRHQRFVFFSEPPAHEGVPRPFNDSGAGQPTLEELFAQAEADRRPPSSAVAHEVHLAFGELRAMAVDAGTALGRARTRVGRWLGPLARGGRSGAGRRAGVAPRVVPAGQPRARVGRRRLAAMMMEAGSFLRLVGARAAARARPAARGAGARLDCWVKEFGHRTREIAAAGRRILEARPAARIAWRSTGQRWVIVAALAGAWALAAAGGRQDDQGPALEAGTLAAASGPVGAPVERLARTWVQSVLAEVKHDRLTDLTPQEAATTFTPQAATPEPPSTEAPAPRRAARTAPPPVASAAPSPATQRYHGTLVVSSTPRGARVSVNGVHRGVSPIAIPRLEVGSHVVRVDLPGYQTWAWSVHVPADRRTHVRVDLIQQPGEATQESP